MAATETTGSEETRTERDTTLGAIALARPEITDGDVAAVVGVLRSGWLTSGAEAAGLEREMCAYLGAPHVVALSSGTAALEIAFAYLGLPPGSRVGVPTWTFSASALAPARLGCVPVLLDIDPDTLNLSPEALDRALAAGLDGVVAVHFGGVPVDPAVHRLAADAGVPVVEDAAHALAAHDHRGRVSGRGSIAAVFSFYASKNLTSAEGGALATHDGKLADFARAYRWHGLTGPVDNGGDPDVSYDCTLPGIKANLPDVLAALARSQLARIGQTQGRRRKLAERYRQRLDAIDGLRVVPRCLDPGGSDHLMVVVLPEGRRPAVRAALAGAGVQTSVHFRPLHHLAWFRSHAEVGPGGVGVADRLAGRAMTLPLHVGLRDDDVDMVCDVLVESLGA